MQFKYFSRSLKPVLPHKVSHFKEFIPKAFPHADDMILDAEVLMVDNKTGQPLPFGTLGVHKVTFAKLKSLVFDSIKSHKNIFRQPDFKMQLLVFSFLTAFTITVRI